MTRNHSDADDIAQETFIRAYRNIHRFRGRSSFYTWLYRITVNCSKDHLRRRSRKAEILLADTRDEEKGTDALTYIGRPPEALAEAQALELRGAVDQAMQSLSVKHRAALVLHEFEGLAHADIARVMGCSVGTVRSRLHYARERMRKKLRRFLQ